MGHSAEAESGPTGSRQGGWSLSEFLNLLDLRGQTWCIVDIRQSGGFSLPPHDGVWFYAALKGSVRIAGVGGETLLLDSGQVRMILSGEAHAVRSAPDAPTTTLDFLREERMVDSPQAITIGTGPLVAQLLCARLKVTWPSGLRRAAMPASVIIGGDTHRNQINMPLIETLQRYSVGAGAAAIMTRMAALWLAITLRGHPQCPLLFRMSATNDPIAYALQLIDADLGTDWSVERLARRAGMSRSSFAARFTAEVGQTPMELVTERRMQQAAALLQEGDLKIVEISARVGYHSEAAFSRRFTRFFNCSPGAMRTRARSQANEPPALRPAVLEPA